MAISVGAIVGNEVVGTAIMPITFDTAGPDNVCLLTFAFYDFGPPSGVASVIGSTLSWTQRALQAYGPSTIAVYEALAAAPVSSEVVTVTLESATFVGMSGCVIPIVGADAAIPFDVNGSLPSLAVGGGSPSIDTTNANAILLGSFIQQNGVSDLGPQAGWTQSYKGAASDYAFFGQYKIVSAAQSSTVITPTGSGWYVGVGDAVQASATPDKPPYNPWPQMGPILAQ
jgi:hypothetical protein